MRCAVYCVLCAVRCAVLCVVHSPQFSITLDKHLYNIQCSEIFTLRITLRPDTFTLNFNVTFSGTLRKLRIASTSVQSFATKHLTSWGQ